MTKFERKGLEAGRAITDLVLHAPDVTGQPSSTPARSSSRLGPQPLALALERIGDAGPVLSGTSSARQASSSASSYAATIAFRRAIGVPVAGLSAWRPDPAQIGGDPLDGHPGGRHGRRRDQVQCPGQRMPRSRTSATWAISQSAPARPTVIRARSTTPNASSGMVRR